jgi:F-type H+-transporting ATPase subunit a
MIDPLAQFSIYAIQKLQFFGYDISITNSTMSQLLVYISILVLAKLLCFRLSMVPNKIQIYGEFLYNMIDELLRSTAGKKSSKYFPLIFTIYTFILFSNVIGIFPFAFTATAHISITFAIALLAFVIITIIGFVNHGLGYLSILLPKGTPIFLAPLMIFIELFAYLARPISLSIRLAANMTAGHVVLKVLASFVIMSGIFGFLPFIMLTLLTGFEIFIAVLQAYIFSVLCCAYLGDALDLH